MLELLFESMFYSWEIIIMWVVAAMASAVAAIVLFRRRPKLVAFSIPLIWMMGYGVYNFILWGHDGQFGLFVLALVPASIAASVLAPILVALIQKTMRQVQ